MRLPLKQITIGRLMGTIAVVTVALWSLGVLGPALYFGIALCVLIPAATIRIWRYCKTHSEQCRATFSWLAVAFGVYSVLLGLLGTFLVIRSYVQRPVGPRDGQDAIRVARSYAKQNKPSYPFDDYETFVRWDAAGGCWVVAFVANRPYIHTEITVDRKTGKCTDNRITYSFAPEEPVAQSIPLDP